MSWPPNQHNPNYSRGQWQPPPATYGQPQSYHSVPPGGYNYRGPPPTSSVGAGGGYYQGAPPTSSVGAGAAYHYQPPPPTSSYQSYPPPAASSVGPGASYGRPPPGGPPPSGPPPGVDPELWTWFQAVDDDKSGRISAKELQQALLNSNWSHFNAETCRLLIGMFDGNQDGTIDIGEFAALWKYVQEWRQCFDRFDKDGSGNIDANELRQALESFGYRLSMEFCTLCTRVFDRQDKNSMKFDDFIQCCVMLRSLTEGFKKLDTNRSGIVSVSYETFLEMAIDNTMR